MFKLTVINLILTFLIIGSTAKAQHENRKASPKNKKPTVVILLADNLGYRDLISYGSKQTETSGSDQSAAAGMKFTNFYAASYKTFPLLRKNGYSFFPVFISRCYQVFAAAKKILADNHALKVRFSPEVGVFF